MELYLLPDRHAEHVQRMRRRYFAAVVHIAEAGVAIRGPDRRPERRERVGCENLVVAVDVTTESVRLDLEEALGGLGRVASRAFRRRQREERRTGQKPVELQVEHLIAAAQQHRLGSEKLLSLAVARFVRTRR
jgi:hypothetical protein